MPYSNEDVARELTSYLILIGVVVGRFQLLINKHKLVSKNLIITDKRLLSSSKAKLALFLNSKYPLYMFVCLSPLVSIRFKSKSNLRLSQL